VIARRWLWALSLAWGAALAWCAPRPAQALKAVYAPDLAFFTQLIWSVAHGLGFQQTALAMERTGGLLDLTHFVPGLALLAPLQMIWPGPASLLALQGLAWGLALVPLVRVVERAEGPRWAILAGLIFALHPFSLRLALADFRPAILAVLPLMWCLERLQRGRWGEAALLGALACSLREDVAATLAVLGPAAWALTRPRRWRDLPRALATPGITALLWLAVVVRWKGRGSDFLPDRSFWWPLVDPQVPEALAREASAFWQPALWPALIAPEVLLPALPGFYGVYWLTGHWVGVDAHDGRIHYLAFLAPALAIGCAVGGARLARWLRRRDAWVVGLAAAGVIALSWPAERALRPLARGAWAELGDADGREARFAAQRARLIARIPPGGAALVSDDAAHLVAARPEVYWYHDTQGGLYRRVWEARADYAVLRRWEVREALTDPAWREDFQAGGFYLMVKGDAPVIRPRHRPE